MSKSGGEFVVGLDWSSKKKCKTHEMDFVFWDESKMAKISR